jgi:hypothetical protein
MRLRNATVLALLLHTPLAAQEYFPPPDNTGGWRTLTDAAQIRRTGGMDLQKLDQAFEYASTLDEPTGRRCCPGLPLPGRFAPKRVEITYDGQGLGRSALEC